MAGSDNSGADRRIGVYDGITLKELSDQLGVKPALVMKKLMDRGTFIAVNQPIDARLATEVAQDFGVSTFISPR